MYANLKRSLRGSGDPRWDITKTSTILPILVWNYFMEGGEGKGANLNNFENDSSLKTKTKGIVHKHNTLDAKASPHEGMG